MNKKTGLLVVSLVFFLTYPVLSEIISARDLRVNNEVTSSTTSLATKIPISPAPVFSWELTQGIISSFTVIVSTSANFSSGLWTCSGSTTPTNTVNFITRVSFNADNSATGSLTAGATYFVRVTLFSGTSSYVLPGGFVTYSGSLELSAPVLDLKVDGNNPFNPALGQITSFRFTVFDRDRTLVLRVYTLSGELVKDWPPEIIFQGATKVIDWDGKNNSGKTVARGVYLINLSDLNDDKSVTRKVFVVNQ